MKCMVDSKENYYTSEILRMKGFTAPHNHHAISNQIKLLESQNLSD